MLGMHLILVRRSMERSDLSLADRQTTGGVRGELLYHNLPIGQQGVDVQVQACDVDVLVSRRTRLDEEPGRATAALGAGVTSTQNEPSKQAVAGAHSSMSSARASRITLCQSERMAGTSRNSAST